MQLAKLEIGLDSSSSIAYGFKKPTLSNDDLISDTAEVIRQIPAGAKSVMITCSGADVFITDNNLNTPSINNGSWQDGKNVLIIGVRLYFLTEGSTYIHYKPTSSTPCAINFEWFS